MAADRMALNTARLTIEAKFPQSGFAITDWTDPAPVAPPRGRRASPSSSAWSGLTALLLGGIGVGNAIRQLHGEEAAGHRHLQDVWALRAGSCSPSTLIQALMLAASASSIGLVLGALTPASLSATLWRRPAHRARRRAASSCRC